MTLDPRVVRGLERQLALRAELLEGGAEPVGWKIGFNIPAVQERYGIDAPVVGFLTTAGLIEPGDAHSLGGAVNPIAEVEVAIHLAAGVSASAAEQEATAAIAGLGPAIELVDMHDVPDEIEEVLARNVFHRAVLFGEPVAGANLAGVRATFRLNGEERASVDALEATGDPAGTVLHVARLLEAAGERLRGGDRIIAGSMALGAVAAGDETAFELAELGSLSLRCT